MIPCVAGMFEDVCIVDVVVIAVDDIIVDVVVITVDECKSLPIVHKDIEYEVDGCYKTIVYHVTATCIP